MQRLEIKMYVDVDSETDLAEFENNFYHIDSIGATYVDVQRVDILDVKEI